MADPASKLREDRAMRDAARGLLVSDIAYLREATKLRSIPARIGARLGGGARDIAAEAASVAQENRSAIGAALAVGAAALLGWTLRGPIIGAARKLRHHARIEAENQEPDSLPGSSGHE